MASRTLGELLGYSLRSVSGFLADKTHKYWTVTFLGYSINMLAVPALALAGNWPMAAALMIAECTGRAIRRPAVETMLSSTSQHLGSGWVFGRHFDRVGFSMVLLAFFLSALFAPLVFLGQFFLALLGMVLWGIGMGAQDSLIKAVLSRIVAADTRGTAFGVFDTGFGIAWFLGSAAMGLLYDRSIPALIVFSVVLQLAALPVLLLAKKQS